MLDQRTWREAERAVRGSGIHAHEATFGDSAPLTVDLPESGVLVVHGPEAAAVCAGLSGRIPDVGGDLAVGGRLIPFEREPLSRVSVLVPALPAPTDASTLVEHVRRQVRLDGSRGDHRDRARRTIELWGELTGGPNVLDEVDVPMARLDEHQRWTLDAAAALASMPEVTVLDLQRRSDQPVLLERILRSASPSTTLVVAVGDAVAEEAVHLTPHGRSVSVLRADRSADAPGPQHASTEAVV